MWSWLARLRSLIARRRALYWTVVAAMAATVALVLVAQSRRAVEARDSWGATVDVWVVDRDAAPGDVVVAHRRPTPAAMVPADAVRTGWPHGAVARQHVGAGEVLVQADVSTDRLPLLPAGWRGVAIAADDTTVPLRAGDRVDVVALGAVLATDAVVVEVQPAAVTVGVQAADAPAVAAAALDRVAVVAVRG